MYEKFRATEVAAGALAEERKSCVANISGGSKNQGFLMKQGMLTHGRVHLVLNKGCSCYKPRRTGARMCKLVQEHIVDAKLSVLDSSGEKDVPGPT